MKKIPIPELTLISVVNSSIGMDGGIIIVPKSRIFKIETNNDNNHVIVKLKRPIPMIDSFIFFDFLDSRKKKDFLDSIEEIENNES